MKDLLIEMNQYKNDNKVCTNCFKTNGTHHIH